MDKLIYGKSGLERLVSVEIKENNLELFTQGLDGTITSKVVPNKFWLLSNEKLDKGFHRLQGNLHYKFGRQYSSKADYMEARNLYKNRLRKDVYCVWNDVEAAMIKDGYTLFRGMEPKDLSVLSFDIETTGLDPNAEDAKILVLSITYRDKNNTHKWCLTELDFADQGHLIENFCKIVQNYNPSIILGHNIIQFDLKYIQGIADRQGVDLKLGRDNSILKWGNPKYKKRFRVDGNRNLEFDNCSIYGREIVDTYFLAQAFDVLRTMESYGLKPMIKQLGLEDPNRTFYDASKIRQNYKDPKEWVKIVNYCKDDADDPIKLWDKMGPLFFHMAPMIPKTFQEIVLGASGSKLNALMVRAYLQDRHSIPKATPVEKFEGAVVFGIPGIYSNCFKIDLAALYPSIMIEYEVFDADKDPKGYLLELVKTFRTKRLEYKRLAKETGLQLYSDMDNCSKSILNSFYGFTGATGLNFNSLACASFIAEKGREILEYTIEHFSSIKFEDFKKMYPDSFEEENEEEIA